MVNYTPKRSIDSKNKETSGELTKTKVKDILSKSFVTLTPEDTIHDAQEQILKQGVPGITVVDQDNKAVGFLSEKDCLVRVVKMKYHNDISAHVKEIMSKNCFVIQKNEDLMKAIEYFSNKNFHIIPVVNEKNQVEGVLIRQDVFRYVVKLKQQSW
ncbi:MAG: hypothetical protein CMP11_01125 [Zetaproteobacteria bacterium]|nr:hypothetical protein [Pseudobdellovibrionaceae bacterium]|tara:strand:+ start:500 stop:967 length:468 start_codon:yes stop_codon:yes gene_type:complete